MKSKLIKFLFRNLLLQEQGFTLIELLVVVVIVGVLSAIATPGLLAQIGKAREAEAKTNIGVIARAQQAYHYENQAFYNGVSMENFIEVSLTGQYYIYTADNTASQTQAIHTAYAKNPQSSSARDYSTGIYYDSGIFSQTICVAFSVDNDGTSSSVIAQSDGSCFNGSVIK